MYLTTIKGNISYLIIDDSIKPYEKMLTHLIKTSVYDGLEENHVKEGIKLFEQLKK